MCPRHSGISKSTDVKHTAGAGPSAGLSLCFRPMISISTALAPTSLHAPNALTTPTGLRSFSFVSSRRGELWQYAVNSWGQ